MDVLGWFLSAIRSEIDWLVSSLALAGTPANPDGQAAGVEAQLQGPNSESAADHSSLEGAPKLQSVVATHDSQDVHAYPVSAQDLDPSGGAAGHHLTPILASFTLSDQPQHTQLHADLLTGASVDSPDPAPGHLVAPLDGDHSSDTGGELLDSGVQAPFDSNATPIHDDSSSFAASPPTGVSPVLPAADGEPVFVSFSSGKGGPSSGGGSSGPAWTEYVTAAGISTTPDATGLTFKVTFDQSLSYLTAHDPNFVPAVEAVAREYAMQFNNHITVSIDVGYGEVDGYKLGSGALGESISNYASVTGYASLQEADGFLPASDPLTGKHTYWVTAAEGRALGVTSYAPAYDGYIGLNASGQLDFNLADIQSGHLANSSQYDGIGTIAHEFTEVMGRTTWNGARLSGSPAYSPLDLFHFSSASPGTHIYAGSTAGYFSLDGSFDPSTALGTDTSRLFSTNSSGDVSDWASGSVSNGPPDAYDASGGKGSVSPLSHVDYLVMEAVGWHPTGSYLGVWG